MIYTTNTKTRAALVRDNVALFYPDNFDANSHIPSMALVKEPDEIGNLPSGWEMVVEFGQQFGKSMAYIKTKPQTYLYGTGETKGSLLKNGSAHRYWNTDNPTYRRDADERLYQTHPWVLAVKEDGTAFGVLADNTWMQELFLGEGIWFASNGPPFRVFVITGETPQEVVRMLSDLTGKMPLPPLWSLGYQQCRWSYFPESRVKEIADTFRKKQIPCDAVWMDIHYMDQYKIFTFDEKRFPDPAETNDYLHKKGFKSVWMIDPGIKKEEGYFVFDRGTEADIWVKNADGNDFVGKVWPGDCVFPDFTMEKAVKWWSCLYSDYMNTGIDGVWNDMNEPSVFDGKEWTMPSDNVHRGGELLPRDIHLRYHNVYGMLMVMASREGLLAVHPDKRPFILTRANYIGGHRYAATWTGDNVSNWEDLRMSIPMSINLGLSGQPFNGPDIGGFDGNAAPELFGHWIATGAFYPFSRAHSVAGSRPHEPWAFGEDIEAVSRIALQRRYRLLPYLYTLFYEASVNGMPVMRPVFFADLSDLKLRREEQAFMLGGDLIIVPKWADLPSLPKGVWRSISLVGEDSENDPYQPDLKQRGGSIIPVGQLIQTTDDYKIDSLTLFVCPDEKMKARGMLYHDAGNGYEFRDGQYAIYDFTAKRISKGTIAVECNHREGKLKSDIRFINVALITPSGIDYSGWIKGNRVKMPAP